MGCVLALGSHSYSQQTTSAELLASARKTYNEQGAKAALPEFEKALAAFRTQKDPHGEAITLGLMGNCYKRLGDNGHALQLLQQALAMKRELGDRDEEGRTLSHLGLLYWDTGEYGKAIENLQASLAIAREVPDQQLEGASLNNLGLVYDEQGDYQRSLEVYRQALALHRATKFERGESDTLGNMGGVYLLLGRYNEALKQYQEAFALSERLGLKPAQSQHLGNMAFCYLGLGRPEAALTQFDRATQLARDAGLKKEEAELHKGKGSALLQLSRFNAALDEYAAALQIYDQVGLKNDKVEGLNDRGLLFLSLGDLSSADNDFTAAMDLARVIGSPRGVAFNALALGDLEWRRRRPEKAAAWYQQALAQAEASHDEALHATGLLRMAAVARDQGDLSAAYGRADEALAIAKTTGATLLEAEALLSSGDALRRQKKLDAALTVLTRGQELASDALNPDLQWQVAYARGQVLEALLRPDEAIAEYRRAVEIIESVQSELRQERFRSGYLQDKSQVYIALVRLLLKQGKNGDAFLFAEKLRVRGHKAQSGLSLPQAQSERIRELHGRIRQLQEDIEKETKKGSNERQQAVKVFSAELHDAEREYQNLVDDAQAGTPNRDSVASAERVQQLLEPDQALLEYVVGPDALSVFLITREQLQAASENVSADELETQVELLRDLLARKATTAWQKPASNLGRHLLASLASASAVAGIRRLTIVPNGVLQYVPFAALPQAGKNPARLLIEDYVVDYLPSASALTASSRGLAENNLLALAPRIAHLRYAPEEALRIGSVFPSGTLILTGAHATKSSFKRLAGQYDIIHFATHGYFNKFNPLFSGVQLQPEAGDDGRLNVYEILELHLHARLVTLSACDTALGSGYFSDLPAGDEFVGLARAFLTSGSSSVLATLWEVNDRSTLGLMSRFYRQLAQAPSSLALARAQRAMLAGRVYAHPYYWAPFVLLNGTREPGGTFLRKPDDPVRNKRAALISGSTN
jgi:CHAT domain-containing protein